MVYFKATFLSHVARQNLAKHLFSQASTSAQTGASATASATTTSIQVANRTIVNQGLNLHWVPPQQQQNSSAGTNGGSAPFYSLYHPTHPAAVTAGSGGGSNNDETRMLDSAKHAPLGIATVVPCPRERMPAGALSGRPLGTRGLATSAHAVAESDDADAASAAYLLDASEDRLLQDDPLGMHAYPDTRAALAAMTVPELQDLISSFWNNEPQPLSSQRMFDVFLHVVRHVPELRTQHTMSVLIQGVRTSQNEPYTELDTRRILAILSFALRLNSAPVDVLPLSIAAEAVASLLCEQRAAHTAASVAHLTSLGYDSHAESEKSWCLPSNTERAASLHEVLVDVMRALSRNKYHFAANVYVDAINCFSGTKLADECLAIFQIYESSKVYDPRVSVFCTLINVLGNAGDMPTAIECYQEYKRLYRAQQLLPHDERQVYSEMLRAYANSKDVAGGVEFFQKLVQQDGEARIPGYLWRDYVLLLAPERLDEACRVLDQQVADPTFLTHAEMIRYCADADLPRAEELWARYGGHILRSNYRDNSYVREAIDALVLMHLRNDNIDAALRLFDSMYSESEFRASGSCEQLITKLGKLEQADKARVDQLVEHLFFAKRSDSSPLDVRARVLAQAVGVLTRCEQFDLERNIRVQDMLFSQLEPADLARPAIFPLLRHLVSATHKSVIEEGESLQAHASPNQCEHLLALAVILAKVSMHRAAYALNEAAKQKAKEDWETLRPSVLDVVRASIKAATAGPGTGLSLLSEKPAQALQNIELFGDEELQSLVDNYLQIRRLDPESAVVESLNITAVAPAPHTTTTATTPAAATTPQTPMLRDISLQRINFIYNDKSHFDARTLGAVKRVLRDTSPRGTDEFLRLCHSILTRRTVLLPQMYARIIEKLAKLERLDECKQMYELGKSVQQMPQWNLTQGQRDVLHCWLLNNMIIAYASAKDARSVVEAQEEMATYGFCPNSNAYGAMIHYMPMTEIDQASVALGLFNEAKAYNVAPSVFMYNTTISKLGKCRRLQDCLVLVDEMQARGLCPSHVTIGSLIYAALRADRPDIAEEKLMEFEHLPRFEHSQHPYHMLIQYYSSKDNQKRVRELFSHMKSVNVPLSDLTFKLLLDSVSSKQTTMADIDYILAEMKEHGIALGPMHYASMINACGTVLKEFPRAQDLYEQLRAQAEGSADPASGIITENVMQSMFAAVNACDRLDRVPALKRDMERFGVKMTAYSANLLIAAYRRAGQYDAAMAEFAALPAAAGKYGREPSTYKEIVKVALEADRVSEAMECIAEMKLMGYPDKVVNDIRTLDRRLQNV